MLVIKVTLAAKMYPLPRRWIHGTTIPENSWKNCHIKDVFITAKNPQSNAIYERMHQTVGNVLRTLIHGKQLQSVNTIQGYIDEAVSIAMDALRADLYYTLGSCPRNLIFNRDMFLNMPFIADWDAITQKRELNN